MTGRRRRDRSSRLHALLLAAAFALAATPPPARAQSPGAGANEPDHVVMKTGQLFAGVVVRLNDGQVEIATKKFGRLLIPRDKVAGLYVSTPPSRIESATIDATLFSRDNGAVQANDIPALRPGERLFSVMPGEPGPGGGHLQAGAINPLDSRLYVKMDGGETVVRASATPVAGPAQEAVVLEVRGRAEIRRAVGGSWEPLAANAGAGEGNAVRVVAGKMALRARGGALMILQEGASITLGKISENGDSLAFVVASGQVWVEREAAMSARVETSHARVDAKTRGFGAIAEAGATEFALFDGTASLSSLLQPGASPISVAAMSALRVEGTGPRLLPALSAGDLPRYRDPNP